MVGKGQADALATTADSEGRWQRLPAGVQEHTPLVIVHWELPPVVRLEFLVLHVRPLQDVVAFVVVGIGDHGAAGAPPTGSFLLHGT